MNDGTATDDVGGAGGAQIFERARLEPALHLPAFAWPTLGWRVPFNPCD